MNKVKLLLASQCLALALVSPVIASASESSSGSAATSAEAGLPAGFDAKTYVSLNPDLKDYIDSNPAAIAAAGGADKWATNHYLSYGKNEGRNFKKMEGADLPAGFDVKAYVSLNSDLDQYIKDHPADITAAGGADKWATSHYLSHGKNEGRNFKKMEGGAAAPTANLPEGFDAKVYVSLNPDLDQYIKDHPADITAAGGADKWAISHYLSHGKNEGRNFKKMEAAPAASAGAAAPVENLTLGFDVAAYIAGDPDLKHFLDTNQELVNKAGGPEKWAISHYVQARMAPTIQYCGEIKKECDDQRAKNVTDEENEIAIPHFKKKCDENNVAFKNCKKRIKEMGDIIAEEQELMKSGKLGEVTMAKARLFHIIK